MKPKSLKTKKKPFFSFHQKIFLSYLMIIIITFVMFLSINFYRTSRDAEKSSIYSAGQTFSQTLEYMEYMISSINHIMEQLVFNDNIQELFSRDTNTYSKDKLQQVSDSIKINNIFLTTNSYPVGNIRLYIPDEIGLSQENVNYFGINKAINSDWYQRIKDTKKSVWLPSKYFYEKNEPRMLSLVRKIISTSNYDKVLGIIQLEVPEEILIELLKKVKYTQSSSAFLFNKHEEIICTDGGTFWDDPSNYILLRNTFTEDNYDTLTWKRVILQNEDYLVGLQSIRYTDWKIALSIPWKEVMQPYYKSRSNIIFVVLLVIPLSFLLAYLFSRTITKKIRLLISHMRKIVKGNFNIEILPSSNDEIGELIQSYNYMITKTSMLLEEKYELGHQVKNLELKSLQAQINPHFLYNTLDLLNWMSMDANAPKIADVVQTLSKFYRLSLSKGEEIVSVQNELEHIANYVKIQNLRFDNGIQLEIDVPDEFYNYMILKLTLQPIVENSILHGILEKADEKGIIRITATNNADDIIISVSDDGVGISKDKLRTILNVTDASDSGGFGVNNIHERLRLAYGEKYGLEYESIVGKGTTVRIRVPAITCLPLA